MRKPTTREMSDAHEKYLQTIFGGKVMPNSGATWARQMDVRASHLDDPWAFAVDGKSTFNESISITRAMWEKARMQSHNEKTALALRWYDTYRLDVGLDLIVISTEDFSELLEAARG